ncbi:hypothetical protein TRVA0_001S07316 [Trichomonascus vanleenenianus]|uniref:mediator of RNA polymerase II transcription subunit 9 n=1 Tax=Trichomonascus vanleenenianus TaxID=2268995 RepID=UPI003ECB3785
MDAFISVPPSRQESALPSPSVTQSQKTEEIPSSSAPASTANEKSELTPREKSDQALNQIIQLDLLRMVQELAEKVSTGEVSAKDAFNQSGPIRLKISRAKQALQEIEGLDESLSDRVRKIEDLKYRISRKRELLKQFHTVMGVKPEATAMEVVSFPIDSNDSVLPVVQVDDAMDLD